MYLFLLLNLFLFSVSITNSRQLKPKFCINCKYYIPSQQNKANFGKCALFPSQQADFLVSGTENPENYYYCSTARSWQDMCGKNATRYVKKYKKNIDKTIDNTIDNTIDKTIE